MKDVGILTYGSEVGQLPACKRGNLVHPHN